MSQHTLRTFLNGGMRPCLDTCPPPLQMLTQEEELHWARLALGHCPSARCSIPGELKLRPFLVPWSPKQSCGEPIYVPVDACMI